MEAKKDAAQIEGRFLFGLEASLLKECAAERAHPLISISQEENPLSAPALALVEIQKTENVLTGFSRRENFRAMISIKMA